MIETIPDITADKGFQQDAVIYTRAMLKDCKLRVDEFETQLSELIKTAYLAGLQSGFRTGLKIGSKNK